MRNLFSACCGFGRQKRERPPHKRSRRRHHHAASARLHVVSASPSDRAGSGGSEDPDWHDARDAFSISDGGSYNDNSAPASPRSASGYEQGYVDGSSSQSGSETSDSGEAENAPGLFSSCLSIMRENPKSPNGEHAVSSSGRIHSPFPKGVGARAAAGSTFARYDHRSGVKSDQRECWSEADATRFKIRSMDYMKTKLKTNSEKAIYRLVAMDLFSTEAKTLHVAKHLVLPQTRPPVMVKSDIPGAPDVALPPLLIMNLQLPSYQPSFFGANDGPGQSVVFYFALPEDFDPSKFENKAALGLLMRLIANGREADGSPTRERLKIIARVVNVDEWAEKGPLSGAEYKLLQNYNEKPVLSRPQHFFYMGPGSSYLEVDFDIHSYAFLARKALASYSQRLKDVIWEVAFVVQGNAPEELPEQIIGCGCIYRADLPAARAFQASALHSVSLNAGASLAATAATTPEPTAVVA